MRLTNSTVCSFTVTVLDNQPPAITCPVAGNANRNANTGVCSYTAVTTEFDATATDNCAVTSLTYTLTGATTGTGTSLNGVVFNSGVTTVTWTASDAALQTDVCSFTVTVIDNQNPTIAGLPSNIIKPNDPGVCGAIATWIAPTSADNCSGSSITQTAGPASGSTFPTGITTIIYTATDVAGNTHSGSFTITVNDTQNPTIVGLPSNITKSNDPNVCGAVVSWTAPTSADNCSGSTIAQTAGPLNGSTFPVGTTTVTYTATDASGNTHSDNFTVTVNDTQAPIISGCPSNITTCNQVVSWTAPTVSDNCPGATIALTAGLSSGSTFTFGTTTETYTATDAHGNTSTCSFTVTVTPVPNAGTISGPATVCVGSTINLSTNGTPGGTWTSGNPAAATVDPVTGVVTGVAAASPTIFYTVSNSCGSNTSSYTITVNAAGNPGTISGASVVCVGSTILLSSNGTFGGTWSSGTLAVAAINNPAIGFVTGVTTGTATIFYLVSNGCGASAATYNVTVNPLPNAGTISGLSSVCAGSTIILSSNGNTGGTWTSGTPASATVNPTTGEVTGVAAGTPTIFYTVTNSCNTATSSFQVTVNTLPNAGTVSGATSVCAGSTIILSSNGLIGGTWSSGTPAAATVNPASGAVTGLTTGNSIITYSVTNACGTSTASITITVNPVPNAGTITGASSVCIGSTINLSSSGNTGGTWSSGTPVVATIDPVTGVVTGLSIGNSTITYSVTNSCGTTTTNTLIAVNGLPTVTGITGGASTVCVSSATPAFTDATAGGTWSILNGTGSATITPGGVVTGVTAGSVTVRYSVTGCGTTTVSTLLTVNGAPTVAAIAGGAATVCIGSTTAAFTDATAGGTWSILNGTGSASITTGGVVTGGSAGSVTVQYSVTNSCGTTTVSTPLTVNGAPTIAAIAGGAATVCAGSTTAAFTDATSGGTWSILNGTGSATITGGGVCTGVTPGSVTVRYSVTNSCGTTTITAPLTVNALPTVAAIAGGAATVCVGSTTPAFTDATAGGTWSILNGTGSATITPGGVCTGVTAGTVTVRYTVTGCGTTTVTRSLTVNALPIVAAIGGGAATVCVSSTTPAFTDATAGGTWSILNGTGSATITAGGVVTGVTAGSVTVRYSVTGCGTTTVSTSLTVNGAPTVAAIAGGAATVCIGSTTPAFTDATAGGTWSILNGTGSATITAGGVATGVTAGSVTVRYSVTNTCGTTTVTKSLTVNGLPTVAAIAGGAATVCVGSATPAFTDATAGGTWSILNGTGSASITAGGVATGVTAGTVTVRYTVTSGGCTTTATKSLTVNGAPTVAAIAGGAATVCIGSATPAFTDATAGGTWSILNGTGSATITAGGVVTGVTAGSVTVRYSVTGCGTTTVTTSLTVNALPTVAAIGGGATTVCVGSATPAFTDATAGGTWSILNGTGSATITAGGVATGVTAGSVTVRYSVTGCGTTTVTKSLTVNAGPTVAAIGGGAATVCVGSATPAFTDATAGGTWSILNGTGTASINTTTRVVTGLTAGTVTVRYSVTGGGCTTTATKALTVNGVPTVAAIGGGATTVCVGSATAAFTDATAGGTWSILNGTGSATITAAGVATGVTAGSVTVRYSVTGCGTTTVSKSLTVNSLPTVAAIGGGAATVCVGAATPAFTDATAGGTWSVLNGTGSASINTSTRVVTGLTAGTVTVRYAVTNGSGCTTTATRALTVNPLPNAGTVSGAASVCVGSTTTFTSSGTGGGSWSSLTPSVATVNATTGVVTGVAPGSATIRYTLTNSCGTANSSKSINVSSPPTITATNISISTTLNNCSAPVTFGPNVTVTGIPTPGVVYKIGTTVITSPRTFPAGTTTVSVTATNSCGTITMTFLVTVSDNQSPSITCKPNATRSTSSSTYIVSGTEFNATASDNCGTPTLIYSLSGATVVAFNAANTSLAGKPLNPGNTTITWKATDGSDNATTCTTVVSVSHSSIAAPTIVSKIPPDNQATEAKVAPFTVRVMPNPTSYYFTLQLSSQSYEKFKITVTDVLGRIVEQRPDVPANSTLQLGNKYHPGVYIAEILQGKSKVVLRLIKEGN